MIAAMRTSGRALVVALACASFPADAKPKDKEVEAQIEKLRKQYNDLYAKQAHQEILDVAKKLYALQVKATGEDSIEALRRKQELANAHQAVGEYAAAEKLLLQLVATIGKSNGQESSELLTPLRNLTEIYRALSRTEDSDRTWERILAISKSADGDDSEEYARWLTSYAHELQARSEYGAAQRTFEQTLKIYESTSKSKDDLDIIGALQSLARLYLDTHQQTKASAAFDRVNALMLQSKTATFDQKIASLWGTGGLYVYYGRKDLATPLFDKATDMLKAEIARLEKSSSSNRLPDHYVTLGYMHWYRNDLAKAEQAYKKAQKLGSKGSIGSGAAGGLAEIKRAQGKTKEALALLEEMQKSTNRDGYPNFYDLMVADVLRELGEHKRAMKLAEKYRIATAKAYTKRTLAYEYGALEAIDIHAAGGDTTAAEKLLAEVLELAEADLSNAMRIGTDTDHAAYFSQHGNIVDAAVNFNLNYGAKRGATARLGLTTLLRRKGRVLDAAAAALATIRKKLSAADQKLLDELTAARTQLAKLSVGGAGGDEAKHARELTALEDKIQRLEGQIAKKSAAYAASIQAIDLAPIQKKIPKDARLVEIVNYEPVDPRRTFVQIIAQPHLPRRYAAYIVASKGDPVLVELGEAAPIEQAIEKFRKAVADPDNDQADDLGKALHDLTFGKLAGKLGGATNILIAPDGALNVVPFAALVDGKGKFLIEKYTFTYLTSGRDLLRVTAKTKAQGGGVLFADPDFDDTGSATKGTSRGRRSADLKSLSWPQLPGTAAEADAVVKTFKGFKTYRGDAATEGALKAVKAPKILHLATHGFFLPDEVEPQAPVGGGALVTAPPAQENPLLRSGLAFAGANKLASGTDDGLLTALEATGLDLFGTKLVVLSACETGVGKVTNGDGVYGLRRSLVIAGAESLVMSLWQVDDFATKDLMIGFYKRLGAGEPRSDALRDVQLELLGKKKYAHPFFWAAFLPAGATGPIK